ncbi:LysR family transcriptional regulator [Saccharospirillum mangrovi]|uniref:LysR family transcriptional regulator n=1 Tax=Saccharospirillum mangrovi TaxID=2161747 RepID=UPI000D37FDBF|nr:LysR family transcriptional regulator [Saccharospirillum mangrovi]
MDTLTSMKVFATVVDTGTFAAAAKLMGLSKAMASKHVMHLEQRLNARLLNRNSRHLSLTESGRLYYERCQTLLEDMEEMDAIVSRSAVTPSGTIRLTAPIWLANTRFASLLATYRRQYPDVTFDLDISGRFTDIVEEGFDLALRASNALSPNLIARPLTQLTFSLVAAPAYLGRHGRPETPADLSQHDALTYSLAKQSDVLTLEGPDGRQPVSVKPVLTSNNENLLLAAAQAGMGLAVLPREMARRDLESGRLETVLPDWSPATGQLYAVYTSRRLLSSKVRTFIDFLAEHMPAQCDEVLLQEG